MKISRKIFYALLVTGALSISQGGDSNAFASVKDDVLLNVTNSYSTIFNEKGDFDSLNISFKNGDTAFNDDNILKNIKYSTNIIKEAGLINTKMHSNVVHSFNKMTHFYLDANINYNNKEYSKFVKKSIKKGVPNNFAIVEYGFTFEDDSKADTIEFLKVEKDALARVSDKEKDAIKQFIKDLENISSNQMKVKITYSSIDKQKMNNEKSASSINVLLPKDSSLDKSKLDTILKLTEDVSSVSLSLSCSDGFKAKGYDKEISILSSEGANSCIGHYTITKKSFGRTNHTFYNSIDGTTVKKTTWKKSS